ncbi:MAG: mandelate racemase/muconate lactonizing enzyme family protein [Planctomycetota bacterium]|nr:mandelate racemase/muconate lactonizing enzyme family protein [Planctomycetota bacterium]
MPLSAFDPSVSCERRGFLKSLGVAGLAGAATVAGNTALAADGPAGKPSSLTITKVETFALLHKLPRAMGPSTAVSDLKDTLLIKITTDSGIVGWGETADVGGTRGIIEDHLKPLLLGKNPLEHRKLWRSLWGANFGDGRAVAGLDLALHDVRGKALGQSVAEMYGGRLRDTVPVYAAAMNYHIGLEPEKQFPEEAASLVKRGFRALKARTGRLDHKRDLAILAKVRETVGPNIRLLTDGNGAFTLPQAVRFGKELEKLDFYFFEEPLPQGLNYAGYDELTKSLDIAIAGGEVLDSRASAREHIVKRSFDLIQPDPTLCGGIAEVLFIAEMARLFSIQCLPHCYAGAIADAATLQVLSLLPPYTFGFSSDEPMLEYDVGENPFRDEVVPKAFQLEEGRFRVPTGPGLGIEVDEAAVKKYATKPR